MFKWANSFTKHHTETNILSPDGRIKCSVILENGTLYYSTEFRNQSIIQKSKLGIAICGEKPLGENLKIIKIQNKNNTENIELLWGEDRYINNDYHETAIYLTENTKTKRIFTIRFRIYNNAIAFRYEIPPQTKLRRITIKEELTEFNIDQNSRSWTIPAYQPNRYEYNYEEKYIRNLTNSVHTPLTINTPNGYYLSIHEAALYNYGSMTLKLNEKNILYSDITPLSDHTKAHVDLPFETPWRLIMIAESAIELTANRTMFALNNPPQKDFSWVKTLKFIGIWWAMYVGEWTWAPGENHGATTKHAKEYIDAAVRLGISGLLIEGWNIGWEGDWLENGVNNSFTESTSDFNLGEVARYANSHDIELIGHHETVGFVSNYEKQMEKSYNLYAANGVHYIKTGYAGSMMSINGQKEFHHSQLGVLHYQKTVELAAKKHICLDIHEPIKGTGIERTWPNLLSREGARGQEYEGGSLSPSHACYLPFTRLLSGGMDYTSGIFDIDNPKKRIASTLSRQLALYVTIYSGMQMAADRPKIYEERFKKEFDFIRKVPTNFEKTVPIAGEIGKYYVVARKDRNSNDWYIGGITNEENRKIILTLDFLESNKYNAKIYTDSENAHCQNNPFGIIIREKCIHKGDSIELNLAPGGGFAIRLEEK